MCPASWKSFCLLQSFFSERTDRERWSLGGAINMKAETKGKVIETKEVPLDSRRAQEPLKTSDSAGDFQSPTPDFTMADSQRDGEGGAAEPPARRGEKRPNIGLYLEGKLSLVLALGLSQ